jgi:uncharacterized protein YjbI with pentapeptide repeats
MESPAGGTETSIDWGSDRPGTFSALPADAGLLDQEGDVVPPELAALVERRDRGERFPAGDEPLRLSGIRLVNADLSGLDLSGIDLSYAELTHCTLRGVRLVRANLTGATLRDADLAGAELLAADLSGADLSNANLTRAGLLQARAPEAIFFGARCVGASFNGADLARADFRAAELTDTTLTEADLDEAVLATALLAGADLTGATLSGATLRDADLRGGRLRNVVGYRTADWIDTDITDVDFTGAWNVRRHILDTNFIHEFRTQSRTHELLYRLWWVTSDCGRSLLRWSLWTALVAVAYAVAYAVMDVDWGGSQTAISPLYFSVVTFTTLGFGDVLPRSAPAQLLVMSEVILGYLSLGGMMSILSDKMARRAG